MINFRINTDKQTRRIVRIGLMLFLVLLVNMGYGYNKMFYESFKKVVSGQKQTVVTKK